MGRIDIVRMLNLGGQRLILLKGELGEFSSFLAHSFGCYGALCPIAIYKGQTGEKGPKRPLFSSDPQTLKYSRSTYHENAKVLTNLVKLVIPPREFSLVNSEAKL